MCIVFGLTGCAIQVRRCVFMYDEMACTVPREDLFPLIRRAIRFRTYLYQARRSYLKCNFWPKGSQKYQSKYLSSFQRS